MIWLLACVVEETHITPPGATETVILEDTATCERSGSLSIDTDPVLWSWWQGEDTPSVERDLEVLAEPCDAFVALSSETWLGASIEDGVLTLTADPWAAASGRHEAHITLHDSDSAEVLARIDVSLEMLRSPEEASSRDVLLVAADGLDAEVLPLVDTPNIDRLAAWGVIATATTQTTDLTTCGPGWASVLTGTESHGVWTDGIPLTMDPFEDLDERIWAGAEWVGFSDLIAVDADEDVLEEALGALRGGLSQVYLVELHALDTAGHSGGFSADNPEYVAALEDLDEDLGQLVDVLLERPEIASEEWLIVMTSDHGGDAWGTHGTMSEDYQAVPLLLAGPSLLATELDGASHLDVAPTMRAFLGVDPIDFSGTDWWGFERDCTNTLDDDGDGVTDCDDSDCAGTIECNECPDTDVEGTGEVELPEAWHDWLEASCGEAGDEVLLGWAAPSDGDYVFVGETVAVLDGDCLGEELACGTGSVSATLAESQEVTLLVESSELEILGPPSCADVDLGGGGVSTSWERAGNGEGITGTCGVLHDAETFTWNANAPGWWIFHTNGSEGDTILYALEECGGAITSCSNDDWGDDAWTYEYLGVGDSRVFVVGSADGSEGSTNLEIYLY
ncbi:MAG TPA: alkaline phosphatase [Myxococcota bacterium]|nr:alkaline phosphatase [Myxococcota bacterium]